MPFRSPFPGMDPYLESHWEDVHQRLATYACDQLQEQLPQDLCARLHERVYLTAGSEAFIEIKETRTGGKLLTVIEFLSRKNKRRGPGRSLYKRKQRELIAGRVSLVEIDLLRGGKYALALPVEALPDGCDSSFLACVHRAWLTTRFEVYPFSLRQALPGIAVPLRKRDKDVYLDLQVLLEAAYRNGRYEDTDYRQDPRPRLGPEDAAWADVLLRKKGLR